MGERALEKGKQYGGEDIEVYLEFTRNNRANVYNGYVDSFGGKDFGVGVRVTIGKKLGFASSTIHSEEDIIETIKKATKIAKIKEEDPHFEHLPDPKRGKGEEGVFDERIVDLNLGKLTEIAKRSSDKGEELGEFVANIEVNTIASVIKKAIVSTRGIKRGDKRTYLYGRGSVKGKKDGELTTGMELVMSREMKKDKLLDLGKCATKRAQRMFGGEKLEEPGSGQIVVENMALYNFIWPLIYNVNGNNVADKRSHFTGKLGKKVAAEITLIDDGRLPEGLRTAKVDDEGVPMKKTKILEDGKLRNFLFDSYASHRMDEKDTGNAIRPGYTSSPNLSYTNLRIPKGSGNLEDLRREIDHGVLVTGMVMGSHLTNPIKGNFGLTCKNAFLVKNGEIEKPLKQVTVSGNFFELLKNITKVGGDSRLTRGGKLPSLMAKGVDFA